MILIPWMRNFQSANAGVKEPGLSGDDMQVRQDSTLEHLELKIAHDPPKVKVKKGKPSQNDTSDGLKAFITKGNDRMLLRWPC